MAEILVVDDDVDLAAAIDDVLTESGHVVRTAHNGQAGLAAIDVRLPDLILLDIEMPGLDGPGMARELFAFDAGRERIPIVVVSAFVAMAGIAKRIGTPYFVQKPCELDCLLALVDRALEERRPPVPQVDPLARGAR